METNSVALRKRLLAVCEDPDTHPTVTPALRDDLREAVRWLQEMEELCQEQMHRILNLEPYEDVVSSLAELVGDHLKDTFAEAEPDENDG